MSEGKKVTVLKEYRPLTKEELSVELAPSLKLDQGQFNEETAAEVAPRLPKKVIPFRQPTATKTVDIDQDNAVTEQKTALAMLGVISSVISLFFLPYLFSPIGIALGYFGYRKGDHSLGIWAMGLGTIGLLGTLIVSAFVY